MRFLTTLPWLRAPLLLWRQPGLLLAVAAGAFVAVLPAAGAPLFLSSARTATLHDQLDNTCASKVGLHLESNRAFRRRGTGSQGAQGRRGHRRGRLCAAAGRGCRRRPPRRRG